MRQSKEILANEIGVIFNDGKTTPKKKVTTKGNGESLDKDMEGDPDLVATTGTINGGLFKFKAAHFEWLLRIGE